MDRLTWDEWGIVLARATAQRADCSRRQVGAVLMRPDHTIVATGYNGAAPGFPGCLIGACPRAQSDVEPGSSYEHRSRVVYCPTRRAERAPASLLGRDAGLPQSTSQAVRVTAADG